MAKVREKEHTPKPKKEISQEKLEEAAYYHWLERGCPFDDALTDWVEVEQKFPAHHQN